MGRAALRNRRRADLKFCTCLHSGAKHEHMGYRKLQGMIIQTIRGRCEVAGCECKRIQWITRAHRDSLKARRAAKLAEAPHGAVQSSGGEST